MIPLISTRNPARVHRQLRNAEKALADHDETADDVRRYLLDRIQALRARALRQHLCSDDIVRQAERSLKRGLLKARG